MLVACGGGSGSFEDDPVPAGVVRGQAAGSVAPGSTAGVTVDALSLKATRRISRTVFEYDFEVSLLNTGEALDQVTVQVSGVGTGTTIIDGLVNLGQLPIGTTAVPADTITLRHDRTMPFSLAALVWNIGGTRAQSSEELIAQALAAGDIDAETALVYRTYAALDSDRLPVAYRSGVVGQHSEVLTDVIQRWDTLSADAQKKLQPYLLRPSDEGSWLDPAASASTVRALAAPQSDRRRAMNLTRCLRQNAFLPNWAREESLTANVRVWYDAGTAGQQEKASAIVRLVQNDIHPKLVGGLGFKPPADDSAQLCNGGDGKLDIYLVSGLGNRGETFPGTSNANSSSVYILVRASLDDTHLMHTVSHEYMHAIHWAYTTKADQFSYGWFRDALANWATDHVYPGNASLLAMAACHLKSPEVKLESRAAGYCGADIKRDYGAYLPLRFFEKTAGLGSVRAILAATESYATAAEAMDNTLSGGLDKQWPLFGARLWNREATDNVYGAATFKVWDKLDANVAVHEPVLASDLPDKVDANLKGLPKDETALASELEHLSTKYYHFTFTEEATRSLMFHNTFQPARKRGVKVAVRAFYKAEGRAWEEEDWSTDEWIGFCRDAKEQRLSDLVIVVSSAEWQSGRAKAKADEPPKLMRNNIGCWGFKGTAKRVYRAGTWNAGGHSTLTFNPDYDHQPSGGPGQYTNEADGRRRVPIAAPLFRKGTWRLVESFSDGDCSFALDKSGTSTPYPSGGDAASTMWINVFNEALPDDLRAAAESLLGTKPRAYTINGVSTASAKGTVTGPADKCPFDYESGLNAWLLTNVEVANTPVVKPDGSLKGSFSPSQPGDSYTLTFEWDLVPVREP